MVNVLILQTQWCKLKNDGGERSSVFWQCETLWSDSPDTNVLEEAVARRRVVGGSQVLVGVVLALAVGRRFQEGQLLAAARQLQDLLAQVQAALWRVICFTSSTKIWDISSSLQSLQSEKGKHEIVSFFRWFAAFSVFCRWQWKVFWFRMQKT